MRSEIIIYNTGTASGKEGTMERLMCPSMMCANYDSLKEEVLKLNHTDTDIYHVDIMDGSFVPNYAMGLEDLKCIRKNTDKLIDVHLMVDHPETAVDIFSAAGADIIYVHAESDRHIAKTLDRIRKNGVAPGIALNPGTSLESVIEILPLVDYILVMTVNPGFAGQKYLDFVNNKIQNLVEFKSEYQFKIMVDGAISPQKIKELSAMGVDGFVLGTSSLFGKSEDYKTILHRLKTGEGEEMAS